MEENTQAKFEEKLKELVSFAKKKKSIMEYQEISDFFGNMALDEDQMERALETLERHNVDILYPDGANDMDPDDDLLMSGEEVDMENLDLSIPDGISIEDPVRMYLKEIGKVPLLSA